MTAAATAHLERSADVPATAGELRLATAADDLVSSVDAGQRRATRLRVELQESRSTAELDQLTGLQNRHFWSATSVRPTARPS